MGQSLLERALQVAGSPERLIDDLGVEAVNELRLSWDVVARPEQWTSTRKAKTLWLCGRGWGKNFALSGAAHRFVGEGRRRIAVVAPTAADCRDTIVEGPGGLMAWAPRDRPPPFYEPSKKRVTFWNGARAFLFSAEEPARLRGPNFDAAIADEVAAWKRMQEAWDMLSMTVRLGDDPPWAVGTTPRPVPLIKELKADPDFDVIRRSTYENSKNLARSWLARLRKKYEGTRLGNQEIHAEILDDNPGALWRLADIEGARRRACPSLRRVAVAVDPAVSQNPTSDMTGIVSGGVGMCECQGTPELHGFVLGNRSGTYAPKKWAELVLEEFTERAADRVLAEVNQGGDLVEANLRANGWEHVPYTAVHATKGGRLRAEPVSALYERGIVHHVGNFGELEDNMTQWNPVEDQHCPDDVAALVYLLTELLLGDAPAKYRKRKRDILPRRV